MLFADMMTVDPSTTTSHKDLVDYKLAIDRIRHRGCKNPIQRGFVLFIHSLLTLSSYTLAFVYISRSDAGPIA